MFVLGTMALMLADTHAGMAECSEYLESWIWWSCLFSNRGSIRRSRKSPS